MSAAGTASRHTRTPPPDLSEVARTFLRHPSPVVLLAALVAGVGLRASLGPPTWADLAAVAVPVALHPFVEWILHVFVLHARPVSWRGRTLELDLARYHRLHHADPADVRWQFIPLRYVALALGLAATIAALLPIAAPTRATVFVTLAALGVWYEWIHFLVHTRYRPRSAWLRRVWRHHRLHHFKNEHYWFGVSMHLGDRVLGTAADAAAVPTSPSCRTLGYSVDLDAAARGDEPG